MQHQLHSSNTLLQLTKERTQNGKNPDRTGICRPERRCSAKAFAAALNAQVFQAVDSTTETLLAQGKSDDWFDALVGKVAALNVDNLVIEGITPDAEKLFLAGKNVELALSLDAGVVLALKSDNTDAAAVTQQLNLAKQLYTNSPGLLEGFIIDGAAAALGAQVGEQTGLTFFGSSDKLQDVSALAKREAKRLSPAQFRYNLIDFARKADMRIVLPEGAEPRTVAAAAICHEKRHRPLRTVGYPRRS